MGRVWSEPRRVHVGRESSCQLHAGRESVHAESTLRESVPAESMPGERESPLHPRREREHSRRVHTGTEKVHTGTEKVSAASMPGEHTAFVLHVEALTSHPSRPGQVGRGAIAGPGPVLS